jgi:hypothetical protein
VFLKTSSGECVHVSTLLSALSGVEYAGEFTEYTLNLSALGGRHVDLCVVSKEEGCAGGVFRVDLSAQRVHYAGRVDSVRELSTGFKRLDTLVREICELRRAWSSVLCACPSSAVECYEAFLKARVAHVYSLYRRVKEAWLEYSQEYLGFTYGLVHSALLEYCRLVSTHGLGEICQRACRSESVEWRGVVADYRCGETLLRVYLEKMISGVKPDILLETPSRRILIECKQGPVKTWLVKAVKQAKRYRALSSYTVLLTPRALSSEELSVLRQHYDIVVEGCTVENSECRSRLRGEVLGLLGLTPGDTRS